MMMMIEKIRNTFLNILGFVTGIIAASVAIYLFEAAALFVIIAGGFFALAMRKKHKKFTSEIDNLKNEIDNLKNEINKLRENK